MNDSKNGFDVAYDSLVAVLGGAAAAATFTYMSAPEYVTVVVFLLLWAVVFATGYGIQRVIEML